MTNKINQAIGVWMNIIVDFFTRKFNWSQTAALVLNEQNAACEDIASKLQEQRRILQETLVFKWFAWLLPEVPRFDDCYAGAAEDTLFGRCMRRCPWIGGLWEARGNLRRCEFGLGNMKKEVDRFNEQLRSNWLVGKLLPEITIGEGERALSYGNHNVYIGMAVISVLIGGMMLAGKRMCSKGKKDKRLDENNEEFCLSDKTEKEEFLEESPLKEEARKDEEPGRVSDQKHTNLEKENKELRQKLIEFRKRLEELKEKEMQEKLKAQKVSDNQRLERECAKKDHMNEQKLLEKLEIENEELKKMQKEKTECLNEFICKEDEWKREKKMIEKLKAEKASDYQRLEKECAKKDLQMNEQEKLLEKFRTENEELKKVIKEKTEQKKDKRGALIKDGLFAHMNNRVKEAIDIFTEALAMEAEKEEETALLHVLRAEARAATEIPPNLDIVLDCCQAIDKGLEGWRAYMIRGRHLLKLGLFDAALKDFETVNVNNPSEKCVKFIEDTKVLKKKWEKQNHYEVLGVERTATKAEIMKSFKGMSMKFHPDRHRDKPDFLQEAFEEKYKTMVNAKLILADEGNRNKYDSELHGHCPRQRQEDQQYHDQQPRRDQHRQYYHQERRWKQNQQHYQQHPGREQHRQYYHYEQRWKQNPQHYE